MGHYAAEMSCPSCGKTRCSCPPAPDISSEHWVVGDHFTVQRASAYQQASNRHGMGFYNRMMAPHFPDQKDAHAHAAELIQKEITATENRLLDLKLRQIELAAEASNTDAKPQPAGPRP